MSVEEKENVVDPAAVRLELKAWEVAFKEQHGRKAGREDIKKDATIQSKYKLYNELTTWRTRSARDRPKPAGTPSKSGKLVHSRVEKPARVPVPAATPRRTPSKKYSSLQPASLCPVPEADPTPAFIRNALGPTPQRDGQVLSIFDIAIEQTPQESHNHSPSRSNGVAFIAGTPSKTVTSEESRGGHSRTPQSLSKRYFLDAFAGTPLKRKRDDTDDDLGGRTNSSSRRKFATPSFLRRTAPLSSIAENENADTAATSSHGPTMFGKRRLVRSLSSIIQGLKKQEEKRMDDDWDVLNEIEEEDANGGEKKQPPKVQVQDSQNQQLLGEDMPLGPDQMLESDEEDSDKNAAGEVTTRKPWKKKGLKRQTRRVKMKPVLHKAKKFDEREDSEEEEREDQEAERVAETQLGPTLDDADELGGDFKGDADDAAVSDDEASSKAKKKKKAAPKTTAKSKGKGAVQEVEEPKKKKGRKVDPLAHANFRALKIKNKNSKASGKGGRRFGRR